MHGLRFPAFRREWITGRTPGRTEPANPCAHDTAFRSAGLSDLERAAKIVCDTCLSFGNVKFVKAEVRKEGTLRGVKSVTAEMEETR